MTDTDTTIHDDRPPEWDESTVENDLAYAAAAGGLTDDPDMADAADLIDSTNDGDVELAGFTDGTDPDVVARTRAWLDANADAVCS